VEIPTDYGQANILFGGGGLPTGAQCTFGSQADHLEPDPAVLGSTIATALSASDWPDMWVNEVVVTGVLVKLGPNDTGPSAVTAASIGGGYTSQDGHPNTAWLIHKGTPFGGRAGRGRMYWPGVPDAEVDQDGSIAPATLPVHQAAFDDFIAHLNDAGLNLFLLHGEDSPITTPSPILSWSVDAMVATQRRRLRR
jgi:hypothetical protein